jgi:uncharacterized protein YbjT (DUF2867 family)
MSQQLRVLVTGAGGRVGKEVVAHLAQNKDVFIRAGCRRADRSEFLKSLGAHEVVALDYADPSTFKSALEGVNAVFSSSPDPSLAGHKEFMAYLRDQKFPINHIVRLSAFGAEQNSACYDHDKHVSNSNGAIPKMLVGYWMAEKACIDSGVPTTSLRGNFFMNHLIKNELENIETNGKFSTPLGECKNSFACTNDIGELAALCLTQGPAQHGKKFYEITGPQPQSMHEVAADLGKVMGKEIQYVPQETGQFLIDFGPTRSELFEYLRNGFYTRVAPDFYNLTGRRATTYYEYLTTKGKAGETGLEELYQAGVWAKGKDIMKDVKH